MISKPVEFTEAQRVLTLRALIEFSAIQSERLAEMDPLSPQRTRAQWEQDVVESTIDLIERSVE